MVLILIALVQVLTEGYYWQYLPSYLLIMMVILVSVLLKTHDSKVKKTLIRFTLLVMTLAALIPWIIFIPVPSLTKVHSKYEVGTRIFRWVDVDREEQITVDPQDKRNVVVQAWYPIEENEAGIHSFYLDGLGNLPEKIGIIPRRIFDHYGQVDTHAILNAPPSKVREQWPVIIFLTGNGASRAFYTSVVTGLASRGYVVLAIDHPYESMVTQLADGKIVSTIEVHPQGDPDLLNFMEARMDLRLADIKFVLNQLENRKGSNDDFILSLDQNRIAIAGHSLGGATAAVAMAYDLRIKAAVNIDGTLYGELPKPNGTRPFLLLESKKDGSERFLRYEKGNKKLFSHFGGGYRYEISDADHYSFTDAPLLLAFPTRFVAGRILSFGNAPAKTHTITVDFLTTFFDSAINDRLPDMTSLSDRYPNTIRKPID